MQEQLRTKRQLLADSEYEWIPTNLTFNFTLPKKNIFFFFFDIKKGERRIFFNVTRGKEI
jgi:hypothetical protein